MKQLRTALLASTLALSLLTVTAATGDSEEPSVERSLDASAWSPPGEPDAARDFPTRPKATRKALGTVLEEAGLAVDRKAKDEDLLTGFTWFTRKDFGYNVATEPPKIEPLYPFLQSNQLSIGHYRLRVRLTPTDGGTRVALIAQIVAPAFNMATQDHLDMERQSNGTIEKTILDRLQQLLDPTPPDASTD